MLLPDLCNRPHDYEHPWFARFPGAQLALCPTAGCFPDPRAGFVRAALDHLAAIQSRLGTRLTARLQLRPIRSRLPCLSAKDPGAAVDGGAASAWRYRPRARLASDL